VTIGTGPTDLERVAGADLWLDWEIEVRLSYVSLEAVPPGATLTISDE
jgi:hypothetical protein